MVCSNIRLIGQLSSILIASSLKVLQPKRTLKFCKFVYDTKIDFGPTKINQDQIKNGEPKIGTI